LPTAFIFAGIFRNRVLDPRLAEGEQSLQEQNHKRRPQHHGDASMGMRDPSHPSHDSKMLWENALPNGARRLLDAGAGTEEKHCSAVANPVNYEPAVLR
jgi:hypothetical protein